MPQLWPVWWQRYSVILSPSLHSVSRKLSVVGHHTIGPQPPSSPSSPARSHPLSPLSYWCHRDQLRESRGASQAFMVCDWQDRRSNPLLLCFPRRTVCMWRCVCPIIARAVAGQRRAGTHQSGLRLDFLCVVFWPAAAERGPRRNTLHSFSFWQISCCDCGFYCYLDAHITLDQTILWNRSISLPNYSPHTTMISNILLFCLSTIIIFVSNRLCFFYQRAWMIDIKATPHKISPQ